MLRKNSTSARYMMSWFVLFLYFLEWRILSNSPHLRSHLAKDKAISTASRNPNSLDLHSLIRTSIFQTHLCRPHGLEQLYRTILQQITHNPQLKQQKAMLWASGHSSITIATSWWSILSFISIYDWKKPFFYIYKHIQM